MPEINLGELTPDDVNVNIDVVTPTGEIDVSQVSIDIESETSGWTVQYVFADSAGPFGLRFINILGPDGYSTTIDGTVADLIADTLSPAAATAEMKHDQLPAESGG